MKAVTDLNSRISEISISNAVAQIVYERQVIGWGGIACEESMQNRLHVKYANTLQLGEF